MSREVKTDYDSLESFFRAYSLSEQFSEPQFIEHLKSQHKKIFALMVYASEMDFQGNNSFAPQCQSYFNECISDLIECLFCWCNGVYKSALLSLRSAIETFIKAVIGNRNPDIFVEKSMYSVFDQAAIDPWLSGQIGCKYFNNLHTNYGTLCQTVHSAYSDNLEHINSVGMLPKYDSKESKSVCNIFVSTVESILTLLLLNTPSIVHHMHPTNQRIFLEAIPKDAKREIRL